MDQGTGVEFRQRFIYYGYQGYLWGYLINFDFQAIKGPEKKGPKDEEGAKVFVGKNFVEVQFKFILGQGLEF